MRKTEAIDLFGGVGNLANALGVSRQTVWLWPEQLEQTQADRVNGALMRLGMLQASKKKDSVND